MATAAVVPFVTIDEYLHTAYSPDVDYVDGQIEERNLGELDHGELQGQIFLLLKRNAKQWGIRVTPELRVQVSPTRLRVPDICVTSLEQREQIVRTPPMLCIEILSPEDRFNRSQRKYMDYLTMGVPEVWIFEPAERTAFVLREHAFTSEHREGSLRLNGTPVELSLAEVFAVLDE